MLEPAWAKRRYEAHFVSKLTDCDGKNSETESSFDFARDCGYSTLQHHQELASLSRKVGKMLGRVISKPQPFLIEPATSDL
jgi:four helix bundle protein